MQATALREDLAVLQYEIARLDNLRRRIDADTSDPAVPFDVAQAEERICCALQIAVVSLERDAALLDSRLAQTTAS